MKTQFISVSSGNRYESKHPECNRWTHREPH
jgi:hypothetical protein